MAYRLGIVGATGAVGLEMSKVLAQRNFPLADLKLLASFRSAGQELEFKGEKIKVREAKPEEFADLNIALFSAGASVSKVLAPEAVKAGCVVIDNSSAFRMDENVPLVVPEVNAEALKSHQGLIANPNCSTIQLVVVINPLHQFYQIKRMVITTFQSVSGTGRKAIEELRKQSVSYIAGEPVEKEVYPHQIAFNLLPQIDVFLENLYTKEEMKLVNETRKILNDHSLKITSTCVRVPVFVSHSESVNLELEKPFKLEEIKEVLEKAPGVKVLDEPEKAIYPMPLMTEGTDLCYVGRIRRDESVASGLNFWVVADNLRKGAALNAVQIAEELIKQSLV